MNPRDHFSEIARARDEDIDLGAAALWLAAESCEGLDVPGYLVRLDALADAVRPNFALAESVADQVRVLNRELFGVHGFHGARDDYYDPRNSFLHQVIDRKTGIPISLGVLYMEVARRLGLDAAGVNFPGHFLVRVGAEPLVVDAFEGRLASANECRVRLRAALGDDAELTPALFAPVPKKHILLRMLGNLKSIYAGKREFELALACCDRSLLLFPDAARELRDRGLMYHALECPHPALADLERYLAAHPEGTGAPASDAEDIDAIRRLVAQLRADLPPLH